MRLSRPGMKAQRRFLAVAGLVMALFVAAAGVYVFRQPDDDAMEAAALRVFAAAGVLVAAVICLAVVVRRRTGARWTTEEALEMAGEGSQGGRAENR